MKSSTMGANPTCVADLVGIGICQSFSRLIQWQFVPFSIYYGLIVPDFASLIFG